MQKHSLGKTGFHVTALGFGSAEIGYLKADRDAAGAMMNYMLDHGINLIDTAASYPGSEEVIGQYISKRQGEFMLVSKCGGKLADVAGEAFSPELIRGTVDRSLRLLQTDVLDVMLLHSCDQATLQRGEAVGELIKARQAGKIRFVGYSGDNEAAVYAASLPEVSVIETSISIADQANIDALLPVTIKHNIGVLAKRPIANAAWKQIDSQPGFYKSYAKTYTERLAKMSLNLEELGFSGDAAAAWPELALRFTISHPGVHSAIIGTTSQENTRRNLAIARKGPLKAEIVAKIRAAFARARAGEIWTGQT